ncbi:hypothetical protein DXG03_005468 [Asterophora parasitica]|uniref:CCHC-type domain-containing protein n=1 Tax=Asterophora parasitica TaxID=117018 RepID=A0A9P7FUT6_9AGAR|nr:hypothetical protein DXG03_005468 [Asterophora parasitica]
MGCPNDTKVDKWFEAARSQDFPLHLDDNFTCHATPVPARLAHGGVAPTPPAQRQSPIPSFTTLYTALQLPLHALPTAATPPLAPRSLPMGVPMDIDTLRMHAETMEDICWWCQKKGHFAQDCPLCWDMRHLFDKELDEFIMQLLTCQDV